MGVSGSLCSLSLFPLSLSIMPFIFVIHRGVFLSPRDPFLQFYSQPNSADNGSADTVVGKITALHFSSLSLFPLHFLLHEKREGWFFSPPLKKGYEKWGTGRLTGEKVLVVKYSFLISEKTLVRKAGMKRWEGEWNETFLCWSCAQREEQARPFVWTTKTAFVAGHSNKGTGGICVKNRAPASEGTCEARLAFNAASQFNKTPLIFEQTDGNRLVFSIRIWENAECQDGFNPGIGKLRLGGHMWAV